MLAEVRDATDAKRLMDLASAAEHYATKARLGQEAIDYAHAIKIDAQAKLGGFLRDGPDAQGRRTDLVPKGNQVKKQDVPTREDLGLTKKESSESQFLYGISGHAPITEQAAKLYRAIRDHEKTITEVRRELKRAKVKEKAKLPTDKYRVLYVDPPWKYGDQLTENYGPTRFHYPPMTISELCVLPILELCEADAVLFLWVTSPMLEDAFPVMKAWGFTYKTSFVWDKVKHNMGHYNSVRHEFLLVCTRGSCVPDNAKLFDSVQSIERTKHSEKPEEFRRIIEALYQHGKRLELFARREAEGWERWGNQA